MGEHGTKGMLDRGEKNLELFACESGLGNGICRFRLDRRLDELEDSIVIRGQVFKRG